MSLRSLLLCSDEKIVRVLRRTLGDLMAWLSKMEGPPPGKAVGGVAGMAPGLNEYFTADFSSGTRYVLICFIPDAKDGKPHFAHGMAQQITVR